MSIQPVPEAILASEFPTNADRTAGVWNAKAAAWAGSENAMATRSREIALVTHNNAVEAKAAADAAVPAGKEAADAAAKAVPAAAAAVSARDQAIPAAARAESAAWRAEAAAASIEDGPITSIETPRGLHTGAVKLGIQDLVGPDDVIGYGQTPAEARGRIGAGEDFSRGSLTITTSQFLPKSTFGTATYVLVERWGGGSSGWVARLGGSVLAVTGSSGGEYCAQVLRVEDLPEDIPAVVGAGGSAVSMSSASGAVPGLPGGDTEFAGMKALGGVVAAAFNQAAVRSFIGRTAGGCLGAGQPGESAIWGGGGGGGAGLGGGARGGNSENGGAGGSGSQGSAGADSNGKIPGGGGGSAVEAANSPGVLTSGAGARGEIRLTWW